ncbi:MAG: hypothetical protein ABFC76_03080 [Fervidobacterium sp.]
MSTIWKLILLAALIVVVVVISVNSVRDMDYSLATNTTNVENSMENSVSLYDDSTNEYVDAEKTATSAVLDQSDDNAVNTLAPEMNDESSGILSTFTTAATETSMIDVENTSEESTEETQVIIIDDGNETTLATSESSVMNFAAPSDEIYGEMTSLEQSIRKYLSGGHKISVLNSETLYKGGYINGDLADKYNVSFRINGDGYDIVITPKYAIDSSIIDSLVQKDKVKKTDMGIEYVFWIRAYKG